MDAAAVEKVCQQVSQKFPGLRGVRPRVSGHEGGNFLLIFQTKSQTVNGHDLTQLIRVVADGSGKIIKLSTSR